MGTQYLIDTNTLIDAQMKKIPPRGMDFIASIKNENFTVSFVSYIEFLGYKNITLESKEFIALANVIEINKAIIDACINIRINYKIKLPDANIAATALVNNFTIISRNESDFIDVEKLTVNNPCKL
jgi:predicted nucleic acid-binding protein